jgi:hypothetical protein
MKKEKEKERGEKICHEDGEQDEIFCFLHFLQT